MELLTAAQMRAVERAAIETGAVTGLELMERAGRGVVSAIMDWRPDLAKAPGRAIVLCGPGNNGGDGFVVARLLKERGWEVGVFLYGEEAKLPPDAAETCRRWREMGAVERWDDDLVEEQLDRHIAPRTFYYDLVIDALFGIGMSRPMPDDMARAWRGYVPNVYVQWPQRYVAVDIPSGLCSDSGKDFEGTFPANLTVTFHREKVGLRLGEGPRLAGQVRVVDIGL